MKFRKKPVVIEAVQWFPPGNPQHDPAMLSHRKGNSVAPPDYRQMGDIFAFSTIKGMGDDLFFIRCPGGDMKLKPGDWIVTGHNGEKYSVEGGNFADLYEPEEDLPTIIDPPGGEAGH